MLATKSKSKRLANCLPAVRLSVVLRVPHQTHSKVPHLSRKEALGQPATRGRRWGERVSARLRQEIRKLEPDAQWASVGELKNAFCHHVLAFLFSDIYSRFHQFRREHVRGVHRARLFDINCAAIENANNKHTSTVLRTGKSSPNIQPLDV